MLPCSSEMIFQFLNLQTQVSPALWRYTNILVLGRRHLCCQVYWDWAGRGQRSGDSGHGRMTVTHSFLSSVVEKTSLDVSSCYFAIILHLTIASLNLHQNIPTEVFPNFFKHILKSSFQKCVMAKLISLQNFSHLHRASPDHISWFSLLCSHHLLSFPLLEPSSHCIVLTYLHSLSPMLSHGAIHLGIPRAQPNVEHLLDKS